MTGQVVSIYIAAEAGGPMRLVPLAQLDRGRGIAGDRFYEGRNTRQRHDQGRRPTGAR